LISLVCFISLIHIMAKSKDVHDPAAVTAYLQKLEPSLAKLTEDIRKVILSTDKQIGEQIKWNSPAFFFTGEMKPFDAKEYKRDLIVIHLRKGFALLVFPTGARIKDTHGILEGDYKDGRRMLTLKSSDDVKARSKALQAVIKDWLKRVDE